MAHGFFKGIFPGAHAAMPLAAGLSDAPWIFWFLVLVALIVFALIILPLFNLWLQAFAAGANVSMWSLIGMRLMRVDARQIVAAKIALSQAGIDIITTTQLRNHYLAGGHVAEVSRALIVARRASIDLPWIRAAAEDLAGRDVLAAVRTSASACAVDAPSGTEDRQTHDDVARDDVQSR